MPKSPPPTISFVIPAYNEAHTIGPCIESIERELQRTPVTAEIIVVNNASTDETHAAAAHHARVVVVEEPVKGLPRARHTGFLNARGTLIANIDADSRLPAGWLNKTLREFKKKPKLIALSGPYIYHDLRPGARAIVGMFYCLAFLLYVVNRHVLNVGSMVQGGNFVVRRNALEAVGGYDTTILFYGEDTDIARRLHKLGPVKFMLRFPIYSSGRRLAREGMFTIGLRYTMNYFWVIFFKKPFTLSSPKEVSHSDDMKN